MIVPVIPGLSFEHFACGTDETSNSSSKDGSVSPRSVVTRIPRLKDAKIKKGAFCFQWETRSDGATTHKLYAKGDIWKRQSVVGLRKWWGFKCRCTCPNFSRAEQLTLKVGETENYVCEHLHAALLSVMDPEGFVIEAPAERFIPGLTTRHFVNGNCLQDGGIIQHSPVLKRAHIDRYGYFHFVWEAVGGVENEKSYELGAHGDILAANGGSSRKTAPATISMIGYDDKNESSEGDHSNDADSNNGNGGDWWGFETYCTCPSFQKEYQRRTMKENLEGTNRYYRQHFVCKHLAAALENAIDPDAQLALEISTTEFSATRKMSI